MARLDPLFTPVADLNEPGDIHALSKSVEADAYAAIIVPEPNLRYFHLMQAAKEVVSIGQATDTAYKRTMAAFNFLSQFSSGSNPELAAAGLATMRAPLPKRTKSKGRPSDADLTNRSALARHGHTQQSGQRSCSLCKANGKTGIGHRRGSKCPFYTNPEEPGANSKKRARVLLPDSDSESC